MLKTILSLLALCSIAVADVAIIGDSTVASYADTGTTQGWGKRLPDFFNSQHAFVNYAVGGRSSRSFYTEGRWQPVLDTQPEFVFIQFGHNDQQRSDPLRFTTLEDYYGFLSMYVSDTLGWGGQPILVTPVERRAYHSDGVFYRSLEDRAEVTINVANDYGIPYIDLNAYSSNYYLEIGRELSELLGPDITHFYPWASIVVDHMLANDMPDCISYYLSNPGDSNGDRTVDIGDLGVLAFNYGSYGENTPATGDFNQDRCVDVSDLGILAANWAPSLAPEPCICLVLLCGTVSLIVNRKKL